MRTSSLWGHPPSRFYKFLQRVEDAFPNRPLHFCVLGCSDGKFVLPIARRGHRVTAIDVDAIALFGGEKIGPEGKVHMPGLQRRLVAEGLEDLVEVRQDDFATMDRVVPSQGVFTSGSLQYSYNLRHDIGALVQAVQRWVADQGLIYIDYMVPTEEHHWQRPNFFPNKRLKDFFSPPSWRVVYDRVLPTVPERGHVDLPVDHFHRWGHLLAQRTG